MILVIGAGGLTGGFVLRELLERGTQVRALAHTEESAEALRALGADVAVGDLGDPASMIRAMRGVMRVYLAQPPSDHQLQDELNAIALAEQSGAYHVVKLGVAGQSELAPDRHARVHAEITTALQASSLRWTILKAAGFMQDLLGPLATTRADVPVARVDARDVAAVAVRALTEEGHEGASYTLTGPEALTDREALAMLAEVTGTPVPGTEGGDDRVEGSGTPVPGTEGGDDRTRGSGTPVPGTEGEATASTTISMRCGTRGRRSRRTSRRCSGGPRRRCGRSRSRCASAPRSGGGAGRPAGRGTRRGSGAGGTGRRCACPGCR